MGYMQEGARAPEAKVEYLPNKHSWTLTVHLSDAGQAESPVVNLVPPHTVPPQRQTCPEISILPSRCQRPHIMVGLAKRVLFLYTIPECLRGNITVKQGFSPLFLITLFATKKLG